MDALFSMLQPSCSSFSLSFIATIVETQLYNIKMSRCELRGYRVHYRLPEYISPILCVFEVYARRNIEMATTKMNVNPLHSYVECDSTSIFISGTSLSNPTRYSFTPTFFVKRAKENRDCILEIVSMIYHTVKNYKIRQ